MGTVIGKGKPSRTNREVTLVERLRQYAFDNRAGLRLNRDIVEDAELLEEAADQIERLENMLIPLSWL